LKILIIGSEGFIGGHLVEYFRHRHEVSGVGLVPEPSQPYQYFQVSISQPGWVNIFKTRSFDICINAAGSASVPYSMQHPASDFEYNVLHTMQLLEAIRLYSPACRYLHISSAAVYGSPRSLPVEEAHHIQPLSPYGWHKFMAENICREYTYIYNIATSIVRPFSVYGPGLRKQLFWDLYQKYRSGDKSIELWGTGNESRDFIYISDLCYSFDLIIQHSAFRANIYNIASGIETTVKEAAGLLFAELDKTIAITFNNHVREGDPLNWRASIESIGKYGFSAKVSFSQGIKNLGQWLKSLS
jgi:dTDP-glucose 4,6-dehydratase/UDP-glucose 4-epimerase